MMARPTVFAGDTLAKVRLIFPELKTARSRTDRAYALEAWRYLGDLERFDWLLGNSTGQPRFTILTELGRQLLARTITPEEMPALGDEICRIKPRARDVVALLKSNRTEAPALDLESLAETVSETIRAQFRKSAADLTPENVGELLQQIADKLLR